MVDRAEFDLCDVLMEVSRAAIEELRTTGDRGEAWRRFGALASPEAVLALAGDLAGSRALVRKSGEEVEELLHGQLRLVHLVEEKLGTGVTSFEEALEHAAAALEVYRRVRREPAALRERLVPGAPSEHQPESPETGHDPLLASDLEDRDREERPRPSYRKDAFLDAIF